MLGCLFDRRSCMHTYIHTYIYICIYIYKYFRGSEFPMVPLHASKGSNISTDPSKPNMMVQFYKAARQPHVQVHGILASRVPQRNARTQNCSEGGRSSETRKEPTPCARQEEKAGRVARPLMEFDFGTRVSGLGNSGFCILGP